MPKNSLRRGRNLPPTIPIGPATSSKDTAQNPFRLFAEVYMEAEQMLSPHFPDYPEELTPVLAASLVAAAVGVISTHLDQKGQKSPTLEDVEAIWESDESSGSLQILMALWRMGYFVPSAAYPYTYAETDHTLIQRLAEMEGEA